MHLQSAKQAELLMFQYQLSFFLLVHKLKLSETQGQEKNMHQAQKHPEATAFVYICCCKFWFILPQKLWSCQTQNAFLTYLDLL